MPPGVGEVGLRGDLLLDQLRRLPVAGEVRAVRAAPGRTDAPHLA